MKQRKIVSMIGALVLIISAVVLITGCPQPNSNQGNTGNNSGNISNNGGNSGNTGNNGGNTGNNGGNIGNNGENEEEPEESNPVIGVWQQQTGNRTVYWVFFETGEFCIAKYQPDETLGSHYIRTEITSYTVEDDYIKFYDGYVQFSKETVGEKTFLYLANGKETLLQVSSP